MFVAFGVWPGVSPECPVTVRLTSDRSDQPVRSSRGVTPNRNEIDHESGVLSVAKHVHTSI
jgi:hypothetical protein